MTSSSSRKEINVPPTMYLLLKTPILNTESVSERDVYALTIR